MDGAWALVQRHLTLHDGVRAGRIFRAHGLRYRDHFICFLGADGLVLRLPEDRVTRLVEAGVGHPFSTGPLVRGSWVTIPESAEEHWLDLASEALSYAEAS